MPMSNAASNAAVAPAGKFYPASGGGSAAIQAAIDAAAAVGAGSVELGNAIWSMTGGITIDPTRVSINGDGAVLDFSTLGDVAYVTYTQTSGVAQKKEAKHRSRGFAIKGPGKGTGTALRLQTPTGSDYSTELFAESIVIHGCKRGISFGENAYLCRFLNVQAFECSTVYYREATTNNGEAMNFHGCLFHDSDKVLQLNGSNQDHYFYGCSFDYNKQIGYTDSLVEMHGCHFESRPSLTNGLTQFEADNGGIFKFFGGTISLCGTDGSNVPPAYLATLYPSNNGGKFSTYETDIAPGQFTTALVNQSGLVGNYRSEYHRKSYLWANRPSAAVLGAGAVIEITDVGVPRSWWMSNGTNWRPLNGNVVLRHLAGTGNAPVATYGGGTGGIAIPIPGGTFSIPAGMILPGGVLKVGALLRHRGSNSCSFAIVLGATDSFNGNSSIINSNVNSNSAAHGTDVRVSFGTDKTRGCSSTYTARNSVGYSEDATININTDAVMYVNIVINAGSINAADFFDVITFTLELTQ